MLEIRAETIIAADPMKIWEVLTDHEHLDRWLDFDRVVRVRPGLPEPNGLGAVRRLQAGFRVMEERITRFEPARLLEYDVLKGAPGWAASGRFTLSPNLGSRADGASGGTLVCWTIGLHPYVALGEWLVAAYLRRTMERALERLSLRLTPELLLASVERPVAAAVTGPTPTRQRAPATARARAREASREL